MPSTTKLGRVVTYHVDLPHLQSHNLLAHEFTWPRDKIKLLYLQYQNFYGHQAWWDGGLLERFLPIKLLDSLVTKFCSITWQTKTIISPLLQCLWSQNLAGCDLLGETPTNKVTWPLVCVFHWDHVTKKIYYISANTMSMNTKLCRVGWWLTLRGCSLKATWNFDHVTNAKVTWQLEKIYLYFHKMYSH